MSKEPSRFYKIDPVLDDYRSFFDHDWAKAFCAQADAARMGDEAWNLCEAWKGAASTARFPWVAVEMMYSLANGYHSREPYVAEFLRALAQRLASGVEPPLSDSQLASVQNTAHNLDMEIIDALRQTAVPFDRQQAWTELAQNGEFGISVLASQRLAYAAVYYGYEDFVLACFKRITGVTDYRIGPPFPKELASAYDKATVEKVWSDLPVVVARKVRHAIAHNGCRVTTDLGKLQHGVEIIDGRLQITASLTRAAFDCLKGRATVLLAETNKRQVGKLAGVTS